LYEYVLHTSVVKLELIIKTCFITLASDGVCSIWF